MTDRFVDDDFRILTEADIAMMKSVASMPPDDLDYSEFYLDEDLA